MHINTTCTLILIFKDWVSMILLRLFHSKITALITINNKQKKKKKKEREREKMKDRVN